MSIDSMTRSKSTNRYWRRRNCWTMISTIRMGHKPMPIRPGCHSQDVFRALLAQDLLAFSEFAFGVVRPGTVFKPSWHIDAITHKLSEVAKGRVRRQIITLPPRSLKSLCASVALPAWFLGHHPWER